MTRLVVSTLSGHALLLVGMYPSAKHLPFKDIFYLKTRYCTQNLLWWLRITIRVKIIGYKFNVYYDLHQLVQRRKNDWGKRILSIDNTERYRDAKGCFQITKVFYWVVVIWDIFIRKMYRKYHNHTLQTNPRHREEEPQNNSHKTSAR